MRVFITNINGQAPGSIAQVAQNMVTDLALDMGYRELGIFCYNIDADTHEEMSKRIDGILASLRYGDVVVFQTPTWNRTAFDVRFMERLSLYPVKKVLFVHDVIPIMFAGNEYLMPYTIDYYNKADAIILPSVELKEILIENGLTVKNIFIQKMWDHPSQLPMADANFKKELHFPGSPERFTFVQDWQYDIDLHLYCRQEVSLPERVKHHSFRPDEQLMMELSEGGFGLVWFDEKDKRYQDISCPYKLGTFLASGIPVVVQEGLANQEIIEKNGLGLVVKSLDQAVEKINAMTQEDYQELVNHVRAFNNLLRHGYFTKKVLTDAIFSVFYQE